MFLVYNIKLFSPICIARLSDQYIQIDSGVKGQYAGRAFCARAALDTAIYLNYNSEASGRILPDVHIWL